MVEHPFILKRGEEKQNYYKEFMNQRMKSINENMMKFENLINTKIENKNEMPTEKEINEDINVLIQQCGLESYNINFEDAKNILIKNNYDLVKSYLEIMKYKQ